MSKLINRALGAVFVGLFAWTTASAWEIPLEVKDYGQQGGPRVISGGVPLLPGQGQAKETSALHLAIKDSAGKLTAVPAQFRVLANWWRADKSIRWVLVDAAATFAPGEAKSFVLTNDKLDAPAPSPAVTVEESSDAITITTGPGRFVVNKKKFALLDHAYAGGKFAADDDLLAVTPDLGLVLQDTFGEKYYASEGTGKVEVIEKGPLRVCVRAKGINKARNGKGYSRGLYGYDCFLTFYAGSTDVNVDLIVTNNSAQPIGSPMFKDASLLLKLKGGAAGYSLVGDKPLDGKLAGGESVCLYQDSNGADTWKTCTGFANMNTSGWSPIKTATTSFPGYRILDRVNGKESELAAGKHARGLLHASNDRGGVIVHTRDFWQQFPKAVEVGADGTIRVGLFPGESIVPHYLEDASAKGHEIVLHFYRVGVKDAYESSPDGRPLPAAVAAAWDWRVAPRPPLAHSAAAGAMDDLGPFTIPTMGLTEKPNNQNAVNDPRMLSDDALYGNAYGWQVFGERWRSNGGHSTHGARQPIKEDDFLARWYVSGIGDWLAAGDARSRQFRDVRAYRIDDQDALGFKGVNEFCKANTCENGWAHRSAPEDAEAKKYQAGLWARSSWDFPNTEHFTLDLLYDRYVLFGDVRSLENMRVAAGFGAYFGTSHGPKAGGTPKEIGDTLGRKQGWSWRTLERYWELTGDQRAGELLKEIIKVNEPLIGKGPLWFADNPQDQASPWFTQIFTRAAAMTALHTGDAKALAICKALAVGKDEWTAEERPDNHLTPKRTHGADYFCTLYAVIYHLTGEAKYRDEVLKRTDEGRKLLGVVDVDNYEHAARTYPTSAHWLLMQPPLKK